LNPSSDQTTNKTPRTLRWTQRLNGQFANLQYYLLVRISNPRRAEKLRRAEKIINTCSLFSGVADYKTTYDYMTTTHSANLEMRCLVHCVQHMSSHEINTYICVTKCVISVHAKVRDCNSMKLAATFRSPRFEKRSGSFVITRQPRLNWRFWRKLGFQTSQIGIWISKQSDRGNVDLRINKCAGLT
jgi:hypothetical protein